jgi:hypothetical protein
MMLARVSDYLTATPTAAPSPADARAKLRGALESALPTQLIEAERRVGDARDARAVGGRREPRNQTDEELKLVKQLAALNATLNAERANLMQCREGFSDVLPGILGEQLRRAAPGLLQTIQAIRVALPLLIEADQFAGKHGLRPVGVSCVAYEVPRLSQLAALLASR